MAAVAMTTASAVADPAAEQLFRDGRQLLKDGKRDEACERFQRSADLESKVGTLLNLADCREQQGRIATAWDDFTQAQALAARQNDRRAVEAGRRASALEPRLSYMTIELPTELRPSGLAISRNGVAIAPAELNTTVPLDSGTYTIEARAPGFVTWSKRVELAEHDRSTVAVALVVDPTPTPPPTPHVETPPLDHPNEPTRPEPAGEVAPPLRRGALGIAFGANSHGHVVIAVRGLVGWPVPRGAVRLALAGSFSRFSNDPSDSQNNTNLYTVGGAIDYLYAWRRGIAAVFGLGFGIDLADPFYASGIDTAIWIAPRVSPVVFRFAKPSLEVGLHIQCTVPDPVVTGTVGVDWFW